VPRQPTEPDTAPPQTLSTLPSQAEVSRGALWFALQSWMVRLTTLVVFIVLSRLLAPSDFGLVALANVFVLLLTVLVQRGVGSALVQRREVTPAHLNTAFVSSIAGGLGFCLALVIAAPFISAALGEPRLTGVLRLLSLTFVFSGLETVPAAHLLRSFQTRVLALRAVGGAVIGGACGVGAALAGAGAYALAVQTVVAAASSCLLLWARSGWRPNGWYDRQSAADLRGFSVQVLGINLVGSVLDQMDKFLIGAFMGPVALGLYAVAQRIQSTLQDATLAAVGRMTLPTFARLSDDLPALRRALLKMCRVLSSLVLPLFAWVAAAARDLIPALFGQQWTDSVTTAQIMCGAAALGTFTIFDRGILLAVDRAGREFMIVTTAIPFNVVVFLLTYRHGIEWVAAGLLARSMCFYPFRVRLMTGAVGLTVGGFTSQWARPLVAAITAAVTSSAISDVTLPSDVAPLASLAVLTVSFALIYLVVLRLAAPRCFEDTRSVLKVLRRRVSA